MKNKAEKLVQLLIEKNFKIAAAESCTGGLFASALVSVADASKVLEQSFITYASATKIKLLGVRKESIDDFNVVSIKVAGEMATGVAKISNAEIGVGITGIAGPSGGTKEIPKGTVCFGFYINGQVFTCLKMFSGKRNSVRSKSVKFAISDLCELLKNTAK